MKFLSSCLFIFIITGCQNREEPNLVSFQKDFIRTIFASDVKEGPFHINYHLKTVFFSDEIISLFGTFDEYTNLPHGHGYYEGKTFYKNKGEWRQLTINDLFIKSEEKEFFERLL